jgi:hypothetical protein
MPFQDMPVVYSGPPAEASHDMIAPRTIGLQQTTDQGECDGKWRGALQRSRDFARLFSVVFGGRQRRLGPLRDHLDRIAFAMSTVNGMGWESGLCSVVRSELQNGYVLGIKIW